jgi:hypothetical protein
MNVRVTHETMLDAREDTTPRWSLSALLGYALIAMVIAIAWSLREDNLLRAKDGLGYWLGIVGASLMLLLLIYPIRKRLRSLSGLGSVRFWFQTHMIFGILGPVLVLLHSNFNLGSLNGRVALFCTLVVASSGILGRYLYAKIHYGMFGQRATMESLRRDLAAGEQETGSLPIAERINQRLAPLEAAALDRSRRVLGSVLAIFTAPLTARRLRRALKRDVAALIEHRAADSPLIEAHQGRLLAGAERYLDQRLATYRKFAQLKGCERLFGLWHVVHFPLFLVMVAAAIIHVVAVHAY